MISVVVTCYNKAEYIEQCIRSVMEQSFGDLEIIVVDDGSTDGSLDVIREVGGEDGRIYLLTTGKKGSGAANARNEGLNLASGEWMLFLDGDDWVLPGHIEKLMLKVTNQAVDIAYSRYCYTTPDGSRWTFPYGIVKEGRLFDVATMGCPFAIHAAVVRRELALEVGGFSSGYEPCEDWDFWLKILRMGARCALVRDTVAPYRMAHSSAQRDRVKALLLNGWRIVEEGAREDPRVSRPYPDFAQGHGQDFVGLNKAFMWAYAACFALASEVSLDALPPPAVPSGLDEMGMAQLIYDVVPFVLCELPDVWAEIWPEWEAKLQGMLAVFDMPHATCYLEALIRHPWVAPEIGPSQRDWLGQQFEEEDPWCYKTSEYEKVKYEQTLRLIPEWSARALEIGCAEGVFTDLLAGRVAMLDAVDISATALGRADKACEWGRVRFHLLDAFKDPLPGKYDLIVCSEMLYHTDQAEKLLSMAGKFFDHLTRDGCLVMAHAKTVVDSSDRPAFHWQTGFGVETITRAFLTRFHLVAEIETPLYRVQRYQKFLEAFCPPRVNENYGAPGELANSIVYGPGQYLPILLYHGVGEEDYNTWWRTSRDRFEAQMKHLAEHYSVIGVDLFLGWLGGDCSLPDRAVMVTFDDGEQSFYRNAWPVLAKYGLPVMMNLPVGYLGKTACWDHGPSVPVLTREQVLELAGEGVAFSSHSMYHINFGEHMLDQVLCEMKVSRAILEDLLGDPVEILAYPYGVANAEIRALARACGYRAAFEAEDVLYRSGSLYDDPMAFPRIPVFGWDTISTFRRKLEDFST